MPEAAASRDDPAEVTAEFDVLAGLIHLIMIRLRRIGEERIDFHIPFCERCQQAGKAVSIRHLDWDRSQASILAHVDFRKRLQRFRQSHGLMGPV